jgi:hypothetical protein
VSENLRHLSYEFRGQSEQLLACGDPLASRRIIIIPPLFDEMNRMRRVIVSAMRDLAARNIASFLPDLPGCNESSALLRDQDMAGWRESIAAASQQCGATHVAAFRGGCLLDDAVPYVPKWRLSPVKGASLLKTLLRARIASSKESGASETSESLIIKGQETGVELAGNWFSPNMFSSLQNAEVAPNDLAYEAILGDGEANVRGGALWLRAEPQDDPAMAASIALCVDQWSASCAK